MAIRFRVYPSGMAGGQFGQYGQIQIAQERAEHVEDLAGTQLDYERQLWQERIRRAQLETAMQYLPPGGAGAGFGVNPLMANPALVGAGVGFPGVGFPGVGAVPPMMGMGLPLTQGGQANTTNQSASASGHPVNQSVTNTNHVSRNIYSVGGMSHSPWGYGGMGGWLGGLLGGWF